MSLHTPEDSKELQSNNADLSEESDDEDNDGEARSESTTASSRQLECAECHKTFKKPAHLKEHLRTHTGERPYVCTIDGCDKSFTRSSHLKRHMMSHTGETPYICAVDGCNAAFRSSHRLETHMKIHATPKPYVCSWEGCTESFAKHNQLKRHMCTHTGEKPYPCTYEGCSASYTYPSQLKKHIATIHEKRAVNVCGHPGCSLSFATFKQLQVHMKEDHFTGECTICHATFTNKRNLKDHYQTHDETRVMYPCSQCEKEFTKKSNLQVHVRVAHLGEKPFVCPVAGCGETFAYKHKMVRHTRTHREDADTDVSTQPPRKKLKTSIEALLGDDRPSNSLILSSSSHISNPQSPIDSGKAHDHVLPPQQPLPALEPNP